MPRPSWVRTVAFLGALAGAGSASAYDPLDIERALADRMTTTRERGWALLPQIGYSPEKSGNAGIKLAVHELTPAKLGLDLEAIYALKGQYEAELVLMDPELFTPYLLGMISANFRLDPTKEFFGLGNNDAGPEELSTNELQEQRVLLTLALRPIPRLSFAFTGGYHEADVRHGKLEGDVPSTKNAFPNLTGIHGGVTNPLSFSITFNNRQDPARPTRGWVLMAKAQHVDRALDNDFEFTRYAVDASYLFPLATRRQVIGLRVGGEVIDGGSRDVPFYELSSLGSNRELRGYFEDRFLGDAAVIASAEYRLKLLDFQFFDIWFVQIDGVGFADAGRVFLDDDRRRAQSDCAGPVALPPLVPQEDCAELPETNDELRFSYGGGVRFALGKALVARIDVGFSEEETGLVYLTFGQTF